MTGPDTAFTQRLCFWSSHMDTQRKCLLGDYGERLGSDYGSPKHILFIISNSLYCPKDFRATWVILGCYIRSLFINMNVVFYVHLCVSYAETLKYKGCPILQTVT